MAKPAKIQDTVQLLCKIVADCGLPKISPETFRQAKFDKLEASESVWQFMFHVVSFIEHIKGNMPEEYQPCKGDINPAICLAKVKMSLYDFGYTRSEFYNATYLSDSREVLLAFGWLLNEVQLLSMIRTYHLRQARMDNIETNCGYQFLVSTLLDEVSQLEEMFTDIDVRLKSSTLVCDCIQKLNWLNGRICMCYRQLAEAYASLLKMIHRLNRYSHNDVRQNPISFYGWYLLMHPRELARKLKKLEHHVVALTNIMDWQQHDSLFWKWMESVIDAHKKAMMKGTREEGDKVKRKLLPSADKLCREVDDMYKTLTRMVSDKDPQIKSITKLWEIKSLQVDSVELNKELQRIDSEFQSSTIYYRILRLQTPEFHKGCSLSLCKVLPEFVYVPTTPAKSHKIYLEQTPQSDMVGKETVRLKQSIAEADENLSLLRAEVESKLDELISSLKLTVLFCNK